MERVDFLFESPDALLCVVEEFFVRKTALYKMETLIDGRGESAVESGKG